ncbi:hypothetical protein F5144DRAFT_603659 [Chaetomium tenue]|uniref:Uncharacterized protein n=1 Tax=Chaetomium tenue TaxID=1854479 RepID=A0ACB7P0K9_9PEZI|nr:hypothetical protein F5144DRAFT_603659 [Chaetomium globosum]
MYLLLLPLALTLLPPSVHAQQQRCQWATLRSATDSVLEALAAGLSSTTTTPVVFSSPELVYTLNGTPLPFPLPASADPAHTDTTTTTTNNTITTTLFTVPLTLSVTHSIIDQDRCAAFIKAVAYPTTPTPTTTTTTNTTNPNPHPHPHPKNKRTERILLLGAQIHYTYTPNQGAIVRQLNTITATEGDWKMPVGLDGAVLEGLVGGEEWRALGRGEQDGRGVLEGVAGGYLGVLGGEGNGGEGSGDGNGTVVVWGRPCARLEGSVYTAVGEGESCEVGLEVGGGGEEGVGITERQFVVDESVGSVSVLARDGRLGGAPTVFEFRVVKGALRYVHQFAATASAGISI